MEGLRDIKGLVFIEDYSLYMFIALMVMVLTILFFLIKKFIFKKRAPNPIKIAKKELKKLDLSKSKKSAYMLSRYAPLLSDEDFSYLEKYKYKKTTDNFSKEDLEKIKRFTDAI